MHAPIRSHSHIRDLCIALAHRWEPERLFVIITAYLDESGTHDGSPITVMGGVLANALQWERFEREFRRAKKKHGFRIFHTKKFKKKTGDFAGWSTFQCLRLIHELGEISSRAFMGAATMTLDNATYEKDYKAGDAPRKLRLDSKYGLCFRQCLIFFVLEGVKREHRGKLPKLNFVLESGHANAGDAVRIFDEVKKELKSIDCDLLGEISFADKDESDPLMMADFISHSTYTSMVRARSTGVSTLYPRPVPRGATAVDHLEFKPGGLANIKAELADKIRKRQTTSSRKPSGGA